MSPFILHPQRSKHEVAAIFQREKAQSLGQPRQRPSQAWILCTRVSQRLLSALSRFRNSFVNGSFEGCWMRFAFPKLARRAIQVAARRVVVSNLISGNLCKLNWTTPIGSNSCGTQRCVTSHFWLHQNCQRTNASGNSLSSVGEREIKLFALIAAPCDGTAFSSVGQVPKFLKISA